MAISEGVDALVTALRITKEANYDNPRNIRDFDGFACQWQKR